MKKLLKIILIVFVCIIIFGGGFLFYLSRGLNTVNNLQINDIDLSSVEDGQYTGLYEEGRFTNRIEVKVKDNEIKQLSVIEDVSFARPEVVDELFSRIIEKQTLDIDVLSGATVTSKAYLKAIENALAEYRKEE